MDHDSSTHRYQPAPLEELIRVAKLSENLCFSLWYDPLTMRYYFDADAPESARWIFDIEQPETPEFIEEITRIIITEC